MPFDLKSAAEAITRKEQDRVFVAESVVARTTKSEQRYQYVDLVDMPGKT